MTEVVRDAFAFPRDDCGTKIMPKEENTRFRVSILSKIVSHPLNFISIMSDDRIALI